VYASEPPAALQPHVPQARLAGEGQLRRLGFAIYVAQLWAPADFDAAQLERHAFALDLRYLRDFRSRDIARRSLSEMERSGPIPTETSARWQAALEKVIPDVQSGDRITGIHRPGLGVTFMVNGRIAGSIADPSFAARFFRIWLGPESSEPALRDALLGRPPR
jgi:hypothetical protein